MKHTVDANFIANIIDVNKSEIADIECLKKGMTNYSVLFTYQDKKYILRVPGEGTEVLINRKNENDVYIAIKDEQICEKIIKFDSERGYKVTEFFPTARTCNIGNLADVTACIKILRSFHERCFKVKHRFDIFQQIDYYEQLRNPRDSIYADYFITKKRVFEMQSYIEANSKEWCLTHMDAVSDNFLFINDKDLRLIDWEYAAMQDPHIDIAMFCIYAGYDKDKIDTIIDIYFNQQCPYNIRLKIYCYVAVCGLLWSNWCEYKMTFGIKFGEYAKMQFQYARDYSTVLK